MNRLIILIAITALLSLAACQPKYDEVQPKMAPVTEAVFASGIIEPKDAYTVTSYSDGFIVKSYVQENDIVTDHQLLFRLDNRQQNTQVAIAQSNLQFARQNAAANSPTLLQIANQVESSRAKMQTDSLTLSRYEHLYTTHSVSQQDVDNARLNYQSSLNNYRANVESYKYSKDKVHTDLANSESQLVNAVAGNRFFELTAIGPGKVYQVFKKTGDLVRKGDKVAEIGNPDSIVVTLDVDEGSIAKVQLGQQVLVELNTDKDKTIEARVTKIYPHFNETSQSYKVEARFLKEMPGLISGTQLQANIITNRKEQALLIPRVYVQPGDRVVVKRDSKTDTVGIKTGIVSDEWVEVVSGISEHDKIVKLK